MWSAPSDLQFHCRAVMSPLRWESVEVLPGCKWLFGIDRDEQAVMVDLDSSVHYELFRTTQHGDPQSLYRFELSFKKVIGLNSGSLFLAGIAHGTVSATIPDSSVFSNSILLQVERASQFMK